MPPRSWARRAVIAAACVAVAGCATGQSPDGSRGATSPAPSLRPSPGPTQRPPTASPAASTDAVDQVRIPLSGAAPDAIELDGTTAWVLAGEGGTLMEVDLASGREVEAIEVGFGATHLALPAPGVAAVGRFDDSATGGYCLLVDLATGSLRPVVTGELGALAGGDGDEVWALEKADRLVRVDATAAKVTGATELDVGENVHVEVRWGAGAAWVGSDGLPLVRVDGDDLERHDTIEVGEGIPFLFVDELLWGAGPGELWAVDPASREVVRRVALEGVIEILALDVEGDEAWLAVRKTGRVGTVLHIDLATERVVAEVPIDLPAAVRIAPDRVWVASYTTNELVGLAR